jgi:transposase
MHSETIYRLTLRRILDGVKYPDIKKEFGVAIRTIALWRKQAGIPPLKPGPKGRREKSVRVAAPKTPFQKFPEAK